MRNIMLSLAAASLAIPAAFTIPTDKAEAKSHRHRHYEHREWRGRDGRTYCRKSDGTVGLLIGGAAGALAGRAIDTRGERTTGTVLGAAARSEEHTSELQSLMRISYAVFCLKKKTLRNKQPQNT